MFKDKLIKFGYGNVVVTSSEISRTVKIQYIEPPKEVGYTFKNNDEFKSVNILDEVIFKYDRDMREFYEQLRKVTKENTIVEFREYTFDFTNYNKQSLKVVITGFRRVIFGNTMCLAC